MSTTLAALPAFSAPITAPITALAMDRTGRITLASLLRASLVRRTGAMAVADLSRRLRADIGLPPLPETPRLPAAATVGW